MLGRRVIAACNSSFIRYKCPLLASTVISFTHTHHNLKINLIFKKQMEARVKIKGLSPSLFTVVVEAVSH